MIQSRDLASLYSRAHDLMRNIDGLQPQEGFDELLKYMFFRQLDEDGRLSLSLPYAPEQIQKRFSSHLKKRNSWTTAIWKERKFNLSANALGKLHSLFSAIKFSEIPFDTRAAAMRHFLTPEIRRGLGIYLTPDEVVREAISFLAPAIGSRVVDPACGSGTFLIETAQYWRERGAQSANLWASDKNPRMLLLAELNIEHHTDVTLHKKLMDSLAHPKEVEWDRMGMGTFDYVFTNPPFGVNLDSKSIDLSQYLTGTDEGGGTLKRQQSEIVFLERCLQLLKPGGRLAIVLPKSAMTNMKLDVCRRRLGEVGFIYAAFCLPPETFAAYGTQTNTFVLFAEKFTEKSIKRKTVSVAIANVSNVGYDLTGRMREGSQLTNLHRILNEAIGGKSNEIIEMHKDVPIKETFALFASLGQSKATQPKGTRLSEVAQLIRIGKTPARSAYVDDGLFIIKVGNLTGAGIDWIARDRNFVDAEEARRRSHARKPLIVEQHDIVLTSSAHSPVYIAKKIDIVTKIPSWVGGRATFVGEVMLIRAKSDVVDPFSLLAFLRHPKTVERIQRMVRGQTAHLHPDDIGNLIIPNEVLQRREGTVIDLAREETKLSERMNVISWQQMRCADELHY